MSQSGYLPSAAVPVSMGAGEAVVREYGLFRFTAAAFPAGETLEHHSHDRVTFAVMLEGGFDLLIGGQRLACVEGTVFTEPGGEGHSNRIGRGGARVLVIQPDPAAEFPESCRRMLDGVRHFPSRPLCWTAARLRREIHQPDDLTPLEAQALALEMLVSATRQADTRSPVPAWLSRLEEQLHDRFRERLTLDELAREANVHPGHLARAFRRRYGTSLGRYLRRLRLEWAAARLRDTRQPISMIALEAGFADQAHFTRAFRGHWGLPPARYRRIR